MGFLSPANTTHTQSHLPNVQIDLRVYPTPISLPTRVSLTDFTTITFSYHINSNPLISRRDRKKSYNSPCCTFLTFISGTLGIDVTNRPVLLFRKAIPSSLEESFTQSPSSLWSNRYVLCEVNWGVLAKMFP